MLYRYQRYKDDYRTLYIDVIKTIVDSEDNTRPFLASSPTNGKISEQEGWIAASPNSNSYGDGECVRVVSRFFLNGTALFKNRRRLLSSIWQIRLLRLTVRRMRTRVGAEIEE